MFKLVSTQKMTVTPKLATRILTIPLFDPQRPLRSKWVTELANIVREDLFLKGEIAVVDLVYENHKEVIMNGQHQLNAVIVANKSIKVDYDTFKCDEPEDASLLYSQFDNHAPRSLANIVKAQCYALKLDWPLKCGSLLVGAAAIKEQKVWAPKYQRMELVEPYLKQGQFLYDLIFASADGLNATKDFAHLRRLPVVYVILLAWEKSQSDTRLFFKQVRDGEGLNRKMPAFKLRNYLMTHNYNRGKGTQGLPSKVITFHEMASKSITAWNAFRKGLTTDLKYYPYRSIPKVV